MDKTNYTTEHRKGQHLLSEERHEIEVRLKDGWSIYRIAKHLGRPYNTIKNEVKRGTFPATPPPKNVSTVSLIKSMLYDRRANRWLSHSRLRPSFRSPTATGVLSIIVVTILKIIATCYCNLRK